MSETISAIACLVTGESRAAIATICLSGERAAHLIEQNFTAATCKPLVASEIRYGRWHGGEASCDTRDRSESVVVVRMDAAPRDNPNRRFFHPLDSDGWEIHCHGGAAAIQRILEDLQRTGATILGCKDWQSACGQDQLEQEANEALTRTTTVRTAAIVLDQVRGAFGKWVSQTLSHLEASKDVDAIQTRIRQMLAHAPFGLHLTEPWKVVLAGAPNVGKSSLINSLVGYRRSIALDQPGTTRDVLQAHAVMDGWPILLSDTAGIRDNPAEEIEREGIARTKATVNSADLVIWVDDAQTAAGVSGDSVAEYSLPDRTQTGRVMPSLRVINKIDLRVLRASNPAKNVIETSATTGVGIDELRRAIVATLIPEVPEAGSPLPLCERQVAWLREAAGAKDVGAIQAALRQLQGK